MGALSPSLIGLTTPVALRGLGSREKKKKEWNLRPFPCFLEDRGPCPRDDAGIRLSLPGSKDHPHFLSQKKDMT
jgi:hypothetical protein